MKSKSYSEVSTFLDCSLKHFWRYHLRLATRRYQDREAMITGSALHESMDAVYQKVMAGEPRGPIVSVRHLADIYGQMAMQPAGEPGLQRDVTNAIVDAALDGQMKEFETEIGGPYAPDPQRVLLMRTIVRELIALHCQEALPEEDFTVLAIEYPFEVELCGEIFVGKIDQVVERGGVIMPREFKTWAASRSVTSLEDFVRADLQTDIYQLVLQMAILEGEFIGCRIGGKLFDVLRKPSAPHLKLDKYESDEQMVHCIENYYRAGKEDRWRRTAYVQAMPDKASIERRLSGYLKHMEKFYVDPFESAAMMPRLRPTAFPCSMCEFKHFCCNGDQPGPDYRYKRDARGQVQPHSGEGDFSHVPF